MGEPPRALRVQRSMRTWRLGWFLLLLLSLGTGLSEAHADSWMMPQPMLSVSRDGRWYVIVQSESGKGFGDVRFQLVRRAPGALPREVPPAPWQGRGETPRFQVDSGDVVVARGTCHTPIRLRCLDGGKGFVLFETHGGVGGRNVLECRDGSGAVRWVRGLVDLFAPEVILNEFMHTVSSIWWYDDLWIDQARDEIGIVTKRKAGPGLLRVALSDGSHRSMEAKALLRPLAGGTAAERLLALRTARALEVPGLPVVARAAFAATDTPPLARAHLGMYLHARGDTDAAAFVLDAAKPGTEMEVRRFAVAQLSELRGAKAIPLLERALADEDAGVRDAAQQGFVQLGAQAVDALVGILRDETQSLDARIGAVHALWNMTWQAERALPALARLGPGDDRRLVRAAEQAGDTIRAAVAARARGSK